MTDYESRRQFEYRLRKIALHSADALPARVREYVRTASEEEAWSAREQILETFVPLVDHLPTEYVDFALREMIKGSDEEGWVSFDDMSELGIRGAMDYHPPAHVQGPFLRLLRTHEEEGLRLIHGLTNTATAYWCGRERDARYLGYSRTPLPVVLPLASGPKELWGNEDVYCWFRHTSVGPNAVISALMALEVWMEEQVEADRDGGELIAKVMAGSQSVAVLAVCIAVALAFPARCLPGVLPFIAHPLVWRMDIRRRYKDLQGPPILDLLGRYEHINERLRERNKRPQRQRDVKNLITMVVLQGDDGQRASFQESFESIGNELPLQFEEQRGRDDVIECLRAEIEDYRGLLNKENYTHVQTETGSRWRYDPPRQPTAEEHQRFEKALEFSQYVGLLQWANKLIVAATPPVPGEMARAVAAARAYGRAGDFLSGGAGEEPESQSPGPQDAAETSIDCPDWALEGGAGSFRTQAIAAVAAAVAAKGWAWATQDSHADWCRSVLLAAARSPRYQSAMLDRRTVFEQDHKMAAARGLTSLIAQGLGEQEIRQAVLDLVLDTQLQVVEAVFAGLREAWARDEVLCWNCLALAIAFAIVPGDTVVPGMGLIFNDEGVRRIGGFWEQCSENLRRGGKPDLPTIEVDERGFFQCDLVGKALQDLPLGQLVAQAEAKAALLRLADGLLAWTVSENLRGSDDDERPRRHPEVPYEWNDFFLGWLANLARHLSPDEAEAHVLAPVMETWPRLPSLAADLLDGLVRFQVARLAPLEPEPQAVRTWERVCLDLLDGPELAGSADHAYLPNDREGAAMTMVFVSHGMYVFKEEWPHGPTFSRVIEKWLDVVGTNHQAYSAFLTMLSAASRHFQPGQVVGWLHRLASRSKDVKALWRSRTNGERTARVIHAVWQASRERLLADRGAFRQFSELVDRLAASGITLASVIQQELEGLNAG